MTKKWYAGIGSRQTPGDILGLMSRIAYQLARRGHILRSGHALGADRAFEHGAHMWHAEHGVVGEPPWEIFVAEDCTPQAMEHSSKHHPAWDRCSDYARMLHGRNSMIMLGRDLTIPVSFVICWTQDGLASGGTGQAIRIAQSMGIQVMNLRHLDVLAKLTSRVNLMEEEKL